MEDLQRELIEERIKNRDLNQTISDILERMADMEMDIFRNEEKITQAQSSVVLLSKDVEDLQDDVIVVAADVERNSADITTLATFGHWCGYHDQWSTVGTITYDYLTFSASNNMNYAATPLDINTGTTQSKAGTFQRGPLNYSKYS